MNVQIFSVLCVLLLSIGINGKALHKDGKAVSKRVGPSILLRKLVPKHFSIEINGNIHEYLKPIMQKKRNKRSTTQFEGINHLKDYVKYDGDYRGKVEMNNGIDYSESGEVPMVNLKQKANAHHKRQQIVRAHQQKRQINSEDYRDYAFDTTDTDQFNEDDDLLRRYYGNPIKRAAESEYNSFSDIMRLATAEGDREDRFVKRLHYGNDNSFLNDEVNDNESGIDDENTEYDEYDDY